MGFVPVFLIYGGALYEHASICIAYARQLDSGWENQWRRGTGVVMAGAERVPLVQRPSCHLLYSNTTCDRHCIAYPETYILTANACPCLQRITAALVTKLTGHCAQDLSLFRESDIDVEGTARVPVRAESITAGVL